MNKNKKIDIMPVIIGTALLIVGILFCFQAEMGAQAISYIVGIALILLGAIYAVIAALMMKSTLAPGIVSASALIALGIMFIWQNLTSVLLGLLPILIIILGAVVFLDAFLLFFIRKGEKRVLMFITELLLGMIGIALGICILTIKEVAQFTSIILGIALACFAIYLIISYFVTREKSNSSPDKQKAIAVDDKTEEVQIKKDAPKEEKKEEQKKEEPKTVKKDEPKPEKKEETPEKKGGSEKK